MNLLADQSYLFVLFHFAMDAIVSYSTKYQAVTCTGEEEKKCICSKQFIVENELEFLMYLFGVFFWRGELRGHPLN